MQNKLLFVFALILLSSCGSKKRTYAKNRTITVAANKEYKSPKTKNNKRRKNQIADAVVSSAMKFSGTRYKYGGTTKKGIDCSGLVFMALKDNEINFPRISYQMANEGQRIKLKEVQKGDLLFFKTTKRGKRINHVGLVVTVKKGEVKFLHSTSSRGVIVSSLREGYWNQSFIKATRIL